MESIITIIYLVAALAIIVLVLLQQGKGADMGASFGSGPS
ncbi:preprotein translocase subunit SecG, partial [Vibrio parahaemolyticus]|nr:preprotein translocase subunit SecG [Vibrio parahaemolyticus]